ncbi:uncharacterized protein LOC122659757 isoform X2 [Telopea speciosissima]|uniref:uncharacterized protein LOC122659757 isoform X2 n=1 Tax=Telopea speciosissima TaxID=54955 RepID=UPI001CC4E37B|nr:uncharacterized protein LOC122659757 isoform X2 [Telopea speciosissima]
MLSLPLLNPFFPLSSSSSSSTAVDFPVAAACRKSKHLKPSSLFLVRQLKARVLHGQDASTEDENLEGQEFRVLTAVRSDYNEIVIVDTPKSRILLLDSTQNIHSMSNRGEKWTGAYWDEFASLPAIVPQGPIGILGLGGGTVAHLMLDLWPSLKLEGWEIDRILIDKAREYFGLSDLEKCTEVGGVLHVHVGDALSSSATVDGGFSGIIVDLFSDGKVLPELQEVSTWLEMSSRLMPHGRIMVNCGGNHVETSIIRDGITFPELSANDGAWLSWKRMAKADGENYLALTGPLPDLNAWSAIVPDYLSSSVKQWRPCGPVA